MCGHGITYLQRKEAKVIYIFVPELKTDVHAVGPLVAGQLDKAFLVLEGHRHREVVDGTTSHDPADVLCKKNVLVKNGPFPASFSLFLYFQIS